MYFLISLAISAGVKLIPAKLYDERIFISSSFISLYENKFVGDDLSPVAYQMLEGLQPGKNLTWRLLIQKNLTQFLDINLNYQGRKSETSNAIHTGSIQLRAYF